MVSANNIDHFAKHFISASSRDHDLYPSQLVRALNRECRFYLTNNSLSGHGSKYWNLDPSDTDPLVSHTHCDAEIWG